MAGGGRWRHIEGRVAVEEPGGLEMEAEVFGRHDRPVFRAGDMGVAEGVPDHEVGTIKRAVLRNELGQTGAADGFSTCSGVLLPSGGPKAFFGAHGVTTERFLLVGCCW